MNPFSQEQKLFSIITPIYKVTYKHLPQLAQALDEQEYKTFEWIVVFDGPHKAGEKMMQGLKEQYDFPISWYTIPHAGACAARNYGAEQAKGEFLAFPGGDCYPYPEALRIWANAFEDPKINRVWGLYDILFADGSINQPVGQAPMRPDGTVWYEGFKYSPFADGTFPVRRSAFPGWDENCKSLQDWELSIRMLKRDNFKGEDWKYIHHSFFAAEAPKPGGLSDDSHQHWQERSTYLKSKNGVENNDLVVTSLGAPAHGFHVAEKLGADFLPMPSFKPHDYRGVYLLGFYTKEGKGSVVTKSHMDVFERNKGKNIIHWIGTDVLQLRWNCSFEKLKELRKWFKEKKIIHLCESQEVQKELAEVGIKAQIIPIPPQELGEPSPLPAEFSVAVYLPEGADPNGSTILNETYSPQITYEVARVMPDVKFYFFGAPHFTEHKGENWEHLGWIDLKEWMPKFSANLRITIHDGLPLTPLQFLTSGRNVITNHPLKGAIVVDHAIQSIVEGIRKAQDQPLDERWPKYWTKELDFDRYKRKIRGLL